VPRGVSEGGSEGSMQRCESTQSYQSLVGNDDGKLTDGGPVSCLLLCGLQIDIGPCLRLCDVPKTSDNDQHSRRRAIRWVLRLSLEELSVHRLTDLHHLLDLDQNRSTRRTALDLCGIVHCTAGQLHTAV